MIDLAIVLAFVVYSVAAGFRARRRASQNLGEYFLAGRSVKGWQAGFSMAATQFAADTPLLVTGLVATGGIHELWRLWIYGFAFLLMAFVFAAPWRRAGVLTDAELTELRYSGRGVLGLRVLKAIYYGAIINCVVMAMVLVAAVRIAEVFLPWHEWLPAGAYGAIRAAVAWTGIFLGESVTGVAPAIATTNNLISIAAMLSFTTLYSATGGLRAVIATDVVQLLIALTGTFVYAGVVLAHAGGFTGLGASVVEAYGPAEAERLLSFSPPGDALLMPFLTIIALQWLFQMNSDGTGYLAQRSMACRSDADARVAGVVFAWVQILVRSLAWLVIGVGLLALHPFTAADAAAPGFAASRELLFVSGIDELLPAGARGLMLTALLAALASTIDTHLNWGASYWSNDVYERLVCREWLDRQPGGRELVLVARLSNLLILGIAITIMVNLDSIQTAWFLSLLFGAGMGSVLVLRWLWERINLYSEMAAIAASLTVAPVLLLATDAEWIRLGVMAIASTAAAVGVTFLTPRTDPAVLIGFYRRVQPPGFWDRTARAAGETPAGARRALARTVRLAAACALSLFLSLIGFGKVVAPLPGSSIFAAAVAILAALAFVPLWWREVRGAPVLTSST